MAGTDERTQTGRSARYCDHPGTCESLPKNRRGSDHDQTVPPVTAHARKRWSERATGADIDVETAWTQSIPVAAPARNCDNARLYAPSDVLLVRRGGVITTVCPANYDSLVTIQLGQCPACGNLDVYSGGGEGCRWCGQEATTVQMDNGVEISFAEGE